MIAVFRYFMFTVCVFLALVYVLPFCLVRPFNHKNSRQFFWFFEKVCYVLAGITLESEGAEIVAKTHPSVLIGNHQHNIDALAVAQIYSPHSIVLGKFELGLIPFFGQIYILTGNILVKRGNRKKAMESMKVIEKKIVDKKLTVLVFPEGTRNPEDELKPFKKGAYYTAIRTQTPLIPFSVSKYSKYQALNTFKRIKIYIKVHQPIETTGLTNQDIPRLMQETREIIQNGIKELNQKYQ